MYRRLRTESVARIPLIRLGLRATALAAAGLLGACTTLGPDFQRPQVPWLADWKGGSLEPLAAEQRARLGQLQVWWRNFNDPVLD